MKLAIKKPSKRTVLKSIVVLLALFLVAALAVNCWRVRSLNNRVNNVESEMRMLNEAVGGFTQQGDESEVSSGIRFEVLSEEEKSLRVVSTAQMNGATEYTPKNVKIYKVKLTNNTDAVFDYYVGSISARTKGGVIVPAVSLHPEDYLGPENFGLAPGGSSEAYVYVVKTDEEIVGLYDITNQTNIELK